MNKPLPSSINQIPQSAWQQLLKLLQTRTAPTEPRVIKVGSSVQDIASQLRARQSPRFFGLIPEQTALLARFFPQEASSVLAQADGIREHRFLFQGVEYQAGKEIEWQHDFQHDYTWPFLHISRLGHIDAGKAVDVRAVWDLSSFYHGVRLGQAYLHTENEMYAASAIEQIEHWIKQNPYEFGINWLNHTTVAIRAVNWLWTYYCIVESKSLQPDFLALWLTSLREHGDYLFKHFQDNSLWPYQKIVVTGGMCYLGILLPEFPEATKWRSTGLSALWHELEQYIYPDGMGSDGALAYHALAIEVGLSVAALCIINGIEVPEHIHVQLGMMLDVLMTYTKPSGLSPDFGENDAPRFHCLSAIADSHDFRGLLGLGSLVLEREANEWAGYVDPMSRGWSVAVEEEWQTAFWFFASDAAARLTDVITRTTSRPEGVAEDSWVDIKPGVRVRARALARKSVNVHDIVSSRGFEAGGLYVMRNKDFYLVIDAGDSTEANKGRHTHNDLLSFELAAYNREFLIDPGTYHNVADMNTTQAFWSTAYHNTLQVGGEEINRLQPRMMQSPVLLPDARVTVHKWISDSEYDLFDASHDGYARLKAGGVHRRQIWFDKVAGLWLLHDQLRPTGNISKDAGDQGELVEVSVRFHFSDMLVRLDRTNNAFRTENAEGPNLLIMPLGETSFMASLSNSYRANSHGHKVSIPLGEFRGRVDIPMDIIVLMYPYQTEDIDFKVIRAAGRNALSSFRRILSPSTGTGPLRASLLKNY
jgi:hypothetical protein